MNVSIDILSELMNEMKSHENTMKIQLMVKKLWIKFLLFWFL